MTPTAKRRKRNAVAAADDDDEEGKTQSSPKKNDLTLYFSSADSQIDQNVQHLSVPSLIRKPTRSTRTAPATATKPDARTKQSMAASINNPDRGLGKAMKGVRDEGKSANIRTLFKQIAKVEIPERSSVVNKIEVRSLPITSDSLSDEEEFRVHKAAETSLVGIKARRRARQAFDSATSMSAGGLPSQRFMKPSRPKANSLTDSGDQRPWFEKFSPVNLEELGVHKRKVAHVRKWLDEVLNGRLCQRLLILKGPAGTGKTITMHLLAQEMGFTILEWQNPASSTHVTTQGFQPASAQFEEFMGRGGTFGQLEVYEDSSNSIPTQSRSSVYQEPGARDQKRVILVEEFPNTFVQSGSALTSFRRAVLQFLANNMPSPASLGENTNTISELVIPMVMVISETLLTTTSAFADSFTAHRLLGSEILRHPGTGVIEFNEVAPTLLVKALELIVKKEARISGRRRTPGPLVLKHLAKIGDVRSATSALEFLCLMGDNDADWGSRIAFAGAKKTNKDQALTKAEQQSLVLVSQRDVSLGMFHAVGKVVYNKRDQEPFPPESVEWQAEQAQKYLVHCSRLKRSQVSVDSLIDEAGTDISTFMSALHENYVLSCERTGPSDRNTSMDYLDLCVQYLSESDLLNPSWDVFFGRKGLSKFGKDQGSYVLRQDEMAFEVAVRGLLFSLPYPVKRKRTITGQGGDTFKLYYPMSIKLWRAKEELEGLVGLWASGALKGQDSTDSQSEQGLFELSNGSSAFGMTKGASMENWRGSRCETKDTGQPKGMREAGEEGKSFMSLGNSAREAMVLERLPYMTQIMRRRQASSHRSLRDIERIVSFQGIKPATEEASDADAEESAAVAKEAWATDKPEEDASSRNNHSPPIGWRGDRVEGSMISCLQHKLILSDDDIEDG